MRVRAVLIRILLQLRHDKRTIGLMIFAPILVLSMLSLVFTDSEYHPKIGIINAPLALVNSLEYNDARITRYDEWGGEAALNKGEIDGYINYENGVPTVKLEGSDPGKNRAVINTMQNSLRKTSAMIKMDVSYLYGYKDMTTFDSFGPILIGFFVFFFVFLIAGVSFLGERTSGTLERLLATPIHRWEIVIGYLLGFGVFTVLQSGLIAWYSINVLKIMMVGSFPLVILVTILTAMTALSIGTFISAYANNELQMIQFIPIVLVPQVFFSGLFDLTGLDTWIQAIGWFTPLWYVADALKNIMIRGKGLEYIWYDLLILVMICVVFAILNILALKKHRKI